MEGKKNSTFSRETERKVKRYTLRHINPLVSDEFFEALVERSDLDTFCVIQVVEPDGVRGLPITIKKVLELREGKLIEVNADWSQWEPTQPFIYVVDQPAFNQYRVYTWDGEWPDI